MVFWYYPIKGNYSLYETPSCPENAPYGCKDFHNNGYLVVFYLFYCLYFYYSALQIRYGLPQLRKGSSSMQENYSSYISHSLYRGIPFMLEIKCLWDWSFTKTALDVC